MKWLTGTVTSKIDTEPVGKIEGGVFGFGPKPRMIAACSTSRIPRDATSFARGDAVRSGRNARNSMRRPTPAATTNVKTMDTGVPNSGPNTPVLNDQNAYAATSATAPVARLMIPDPR
jgi:hypothetical protein